MFGSTPGPSINSGANSKPHLVNENIGYPVYLYQLSFTEADCIIMSHKKTGDAWDQCAEDLIIKFGVGVLGTGLAGAVLFRGSNMRIASAAFGAGAGVGHSLSNCESLLKMAKQDNRQKLANSRS